MTKLIRRPTSEQQNFLYLPLILAGLMMLAQPATAQNDEGLEEVVVTGSLIKRETSSNIVVTLDDQELIDRGVSNAVEILDTITSIQAREVTSNTLNLFNPSFANFANLRSLGGQSTLTLLTANAWCARPVRGYCHQPQRVAAGGNFQRGCPARWRFIHLRLRCNCRRYQLQDV